MINLGKIILVGMKSFMTTNDFSAADTYFMSLAISLAKQAAAADEVPVGAVIVNQGNVIGRGFNQPIKTNDSSAHAEILAIRDACQAVGNYRLTDCDIYVTLEPCIMCFGALIHARIARLFYGASEPRAGAVKSQLQLADNDSFNHRLSCHGGLLADESADLLKDFFRSRRMKKE